MAQIFFRVYPEMMKAYNIKAVTQVTFHVDTTYHGVAAVDVATANIWFNPD